jgi:hypothetical protein
MLNNRELASAILIGAFVVFMLALPGVRGSLLPLVKTAFGPKLSLLWMIYGASVTLSVLGLRHVGLRYDGEVRDAVIWALVAGLPIYLRFDKASRKPELLRKAFLESIGLTAFVEFFVNLYVFPLWGELLLQVFLLFSGLLLIVAKPNPEQKQLAGCLAAAQALGGIGALVFVLVESLVHISDTPWADDGMSLLQPVVLTAVSIAVTAVVSLVSAYEVTLTMLRWPLACEAPRARHRLALILGLRWHVAKVANVSGAISVRLRNTTSLGEALHVVRQYRRGEIGPEDWPTNLDS